MKDFRPGFKVSFRFGRRIKQQNFTVVLWVLGIMIGILLPFFSVASAGEIQYHSADRRDPFIPLIGPDGSLRYGALSFKSGEFKVEGIIYDPVEGSYALINGQFLKEGDQINNAQVVSILRDRVILSVNNEQQVIWLREEVVGE